MAKNSVGPKPRRNVDRRGVFFLSSALICALLIPTALPKYRWVGEMLTVAQLVLAALSVADFTTRTRRHT
jgi:hypothetical protein